VWLFLILAFVAVVRIHLLAVPLERDEGEYAYAGQLMLEGVPPYRLAYNMKMPGIYAAYALIMAVFGQSPVGIHLGFMLVNFAATVLLYFVGRRYLGVAGAVAASAAYALMSTCLHLFGFTAHATHFVVLAALGATLVLLRALEGGGWAGFFWSGTLFGVAFLMKQPGGAFALFGGAMLLWTGWRAQPADWQKQGLRLAIYGAGVAAPIVLTGLILWRAGVWDKFWWWTVTYARVHATALSWQAGKTRLANFFTDWNWDGLFWVLALAGLSCALMRKGRADEKFFFLSLSFFSFLALVPTLQFTNHYFVMMLPVVSLLSARLFTEAEAWLAAGPLASVHGAPWILFGLVWAGVAWSNRASFFQWTPQDFTARMFYRNDFQVYPEIGDYLRRHTPPSATIAVLGSEPELPFYAHRRSVTGYLYTYDLVQEQPFRARMAKEMISEVEQGRADYVIYVNTFYSWLPSPPRYFEEMRSWFMQYTQREYVPYGVVTFAPHQFVWGPDCLQEVPLKYRFVVIFQRKSASLLPKSSP
jgi:hypothetical protein